MSKGGGGGGYPPIACCHHCTLEEYTRMYWMHKLIVYIGPIGKLGGSGGGGGGGPSIFWSRTHLTSRCNAFSLPLQGLRG